MPFSRMRVIDAETTGFQDDPGARLVEAAWCDIDLNTLTISAPRAMLANPCCPIPAQASAVHHIVDADVLGAPVPAAVVEFATEGCGPETVFASHNRRFDMHFVKTPPGSQWVCSYKCAKRMIPSAPTHSNQGLRYHLGLAVDPVLSMPPHRAAADVHVTAHILVRMLAKVTLEELLLWSSQPVHQPTCEFGNKHKGARWADVPTDYLKWMAFEADRIDQDTREVALMHLTDRGF